MLDDFIVYFNSKENYLGEIFFFLIYLYTTTIMRYYKLYSILVHLEKNKSIF